MNDYNVSFDDAPHFDFELIICRERDYPEGDDVVTDIISCVSMKPAEAPRFFYALSKEGKALRFEMISQTGNQVYGRWG